jgi:hypothetical protein
MPAEKTRDLGFCGLGQQRACTLPQVGSSRRALLWSETALLHRRREQAKCGEERVLLTSGESLSASHDARMHWTDAPSS